MLYVNLLFEKEADYFIVSDDVTIAYGVGDTRVEALFDYLEAFLEYRLMGGGQRIRTNVTTT